MKKDRKPFQKEIDIDIHHMTVSEAKHYLERLLSTVSSDITHIHIIHGYHGGTALQKMVRSGIKNKKIAKIMISLNPGVSTYVLK